ncbi:MAG: pentapeptide repeat-containing protein [Pseudobdellovibrionaceae bacterium]
MKRRNTLKNYISGNQTSAPHGLPSSSTPNARTAAPADPKNFRNANWDGAQHREQDFTGLDLTSANISEGHFTNCIFSTASLIDACLCYSIFINCQFINTQFGATDIAQAEFYNCVFAGWSVFTLDFECSAQIKDCTFRTETSHITFSSPPLVIKGFRDGQRMAFIEGTLLEKLETA